MEGLFDPFMRDAVLAGLLMGATFGLIGIFVVLRRIVFIGMTVAQVASAGTAFAFLVPVLAPALVATVGAPWWHHWGDILCSGLFTLAAVFVISGGSADRRLPSEAPIGLAFSAFWASGILFVANSGQGIAEVRNLVQGDLLLICTSHLAIIAAVSVLLWVALLLSWKENLLVAFDPGMARALGLSVSRWNLAFHGLLGLAIVAGIRFAGLLLIFTYLVVPAVTGLVLARSVAGAAALSVTCASIATLAGLALSFRWDLPASPVICAVAAGLAVAALGLRWGLDRVGREP